MLGMLFLKMQNHILKSDFIFTIQTSKIVVLLYRALFIEKENKYLLIFREIIKLDGGWHGGIIISLSLHYKNEWRQF